MKLYVWIGKSMVRYWIATSNWYNEPLDRRPCSGARDREERQIWWYKMGRDDIGVGDMVLIYQGGDNAEARKEGIKIDKKIKCCFIGNFTIERLIERNDHTIPEICWTELDDGWLQTVEHDFLWSQNEFIKRKNISDDLLVRAAGRPNLKSSKVGIIFKNNSWIRLEGREGYEYYNRVMDRV